MSATIKLPVSQGKFLNFRWIFDAEDKAIARCEDQRMVEPKQESIVWLVNFSKEVGVPYPKVMEAAKKFLETGEMFSEDIYDSVPEEFWKHYENVTGRKGSGDFFRCCP